jgi:LysM repeat protein
MKSQTLPVKRRPVPKGIFRRLSAVTRNRKQRVAAATVPSSDMDLDDGGSKISRALTIIFLIHIVAIALIFFHQRFLDGRPADQAVATKTLPIPEPSVAAVPATPARTDLPRLSSGEKPYIVRAGDNFARIAAAEGVDEGDLRLLNKHVTIGPGLILKIPPKRIVAIEPPEVAAIREQTPADSDRGLVEAVDVSSAPKAQMIRSTHSDSSATATGSSYVVQAGDSVWRIANRFKVSQDALMKANGITDARKMKTGMNLAIPQPATNKL